MIAITKKKPTEYRFEPVFIVRVEGVEPPRLAALDPKSSMSTNSIIPAKQNHALFFYKTGQR